MHQAGNFCAVLALHRQDKTPIADGDDGFLQEQAGGGGAQHVFQPYTNIFLQPEEFSCGWRTVPARRCPPPPPAKGRCPVCSFQADGSHTAGQRTGPAVKSPYPTCHGSGSLRPSHAANLHTAAVLSGLARRQGPHALQRPPRLPRRGWVGLTAF